MSSDEPKPSDADYTTCLICGQVIEGLPLDRAPDHRGFAIHTRCEGGVVGPAEDPEDPEAPAL